MQIPMFSLPGMFGTTLETIPLPIPYISASPLTAEWRERLAAIEGFRVGIHWQGNPAYIDDHLRSIPLAEFAALAAVPGVTLISLQKEPGTQQLSEIAGQFSVTALDDLDEAHGAFMDTAAVIKNLDLVIASDSAVAHLAGAMGCPVWVALGVSPEWRWMLDRDDSPWYPTMRLFRQSRLEDWSALFARIAGELDMLVATQQRRS